MLKKETMPLTMAVMIDPMPLTMAISTPPMVRQSDCIWINVSGQGLVKMS